MFAVPEAPPRVSIYPNDTPHAAQITEVNCQLLADQKVFLSFMIKNGHRVLDSRFNYVGYC